MPVPRSLLGQVMLVLGLGLLLGQAVSGVLLFRAAEQRREAELVSTMGFRLVAALEGRGRENGAAKRSRLKLDHEEHGEFGRRSYMHRLRLGLETSDISPLKPGEKHLAEYEEDLRALFARQGVEVGELVVTRRLAGQDAFLASRPRLRERMYGHDWHDRAILVAGVERPDGGWSVARLPEPRPPRGVMGSIALQTSVIFAVLVALIFPLMRRITRPLARLTERLGDFSRNPGETVTLEESGPADMRRLIAAHNAMEARIAAMLDEKDVMLGAIGHDLKTPLAALRVRIENVPDATQRARMAESIEDITHTLDDILNLARVGRSSDPLEKTELSALVASVVEEYEDMGDPVELRETMRIAVPLRATWLRRAVRNLIGNALRYGEKAQVDVLREGDYAVIRIEDEGPGIPENELSAMLEPFARGEASRNRATGGAGLGLTLARAIAEQHGGELTLQNREEGGLRAELRIPAAG